MEIKSEINMEKIMIEFEKSSNQLNELIRLQNELSQSENDLLALQIRFVHKFRDLNLNLEKKKQFFFVNLIFFLLQK